MGRQRTIPLFGTATSGKSVNVTAQRRVNMYAEKSPESGKLVYYSRPGLVPALPSTTGGRKLGPARGAVSWLLFSDGVTSFYERYPIVWLPANQWYDVGQRGNAVNSYSPAFFVDPIFETSIGPVRGATNGFSVLFVDGKSAYTGGSVLLLSDGIQDMQKQHPDFVPDKLYTPTFPFGATSVCFIAGRYVVNDPRYPGRFVWSGLNAPWFQADYWDPLDFATAESVPDPLTAVCEHNGQLLLFGKASLEFWAPSGDENVFASMGGSGAAWGTDAIDTIQQTENRLFFLGTGTLGNRQVCALSGYTVQPISTPDVEKLINEDPTPDAATALAFKVAGHLFYVLNLSTRSLAYNVTTGEWDEWQTDGGRWSGQWGFSYNGKFYVTDYRNSNIYSLDDDAVTDDGQPMLREIISQHAFDGGNEMSFAKLQLDVETGVGIPSGQGSAPQIMLKVSKDSGHKWTEERWRSLGAQGEYRKRVTWNALGTGDNWTFYFRIADPVKVTIIGAFAEVGQ